MSRMGCSFRPWSRFLIPSLPKFSISYLVSRLVVSVVAGAPLSLTHIHSLYCSLSLSHTQTHTHTDSKEGVVTGVYQALEQVLDPVFAKLLLIISGGEFTHTQSHLLSCPYRLRYTSFPSISLLDPVFAELLLIISGEREGERHAVTSPLPSTPPFSGRCRGM